MNILEKIQFLLGEVGIVTGDVDTTPFKKIEKPPKRKNKKKKDEEEEKDE